MTYPVLSYWVDLWKPCCWKCRRILIVELNYFKEVCRMALYWRERVRIQFSKKRWCKNALFSQVNVERVDMLLRFVFQNFCQDWMETLLRSLRNVLWSFISFERDIRLTLCVETILQAFLWIADFLVTELLANFAVHVVHGPSNGHLIFASVKSWRIH